MKIGTIKVKICKMTGRKVKMYYIGEKEDVENGENGHLGWLCLHR